MSSGDKLQRQRTKKRHLKGRRGGKVWARWVGGGGRVITLGKDGGEERHGHGP